MALTARETLLVLEMLDIPAGAEVWRVDTLGLNATRFLALSNPASAVSAVEVYLTGLSAAEEAMVSEILAEYSLIRLATPGVDVISGNVGDLSSTTVDFNARIARYKQLIRTYVPFYQDWQTMQTRTAQLAQMSVAVRM